MPFAHVLVLFSALLTIFAASAYLRDTLKGTTKPNRIFGWGFRVEGDMAGSILFTRYTDVASSADPILNGSRPFSVSYTDYNTIRFNNDMSVGLGWGSYFDCRNYHFDLLATYDFQIFWNQNMMRQLVDEFQGTTSASAHNLYLQGLTVKAEFDF